MTPLEMARARQHSYTLLSHLFLKGVTPDSLETLRRIPSLTEWVTGEVNFEEFGALHHTLFGFNIFPYEASFVGESGQLGGPATEAVIRAYQGLGFLNRDMDHSPDHIGTELKALSFLCAAEGDAREDEKPLVAAQISDKIDQYIAEHIGRWIIPFSVAVEMADRSIFHAASQLVLGLLDDQLSGRPHAPQPETPPPPSLDDSQTDLKEIVQFLLSPSRSGLFISQETIQRWGRHLDLPRGFGNREQTLLNLFRSAAHLDQFPALINQMLASSTAWEAAYQRVAEAYPKLAQLNERWPLLEAQTAQLLAQMQAGLARE